MFCKYCGENNVDGAKFCKNCGKPLMTTSSADGTAAGYNPEMTPDYILQQYRLQDIIRK